MAESDGIGDLQRAFELLKRKLHLEGLFKETVKKVVPKLPKNRIVTSPTGAALQDFGRVRRIAWRNFNSAIACSRRIGGG